MTAKIVLKTGSLGFIAGLIIWTMNNILAKIPERYLGNFAEYFITPDLFGLIPCGRTCWAYFGLITLAEITITCTIIAIMIGIIKSRIKE